MEDFKKGDKSYMYEIIVYDKKSSYVLFGTSKNLKDYPTIPVGAYAFILDTQQVFSKIGPEKLHEVDFDDVDPIDPNENPEVVNTTSVLGKAIIGTMNIGE